MDIICFSHLRWDFVYQRPQHILSRFTATHRVYYVEEPVFDAASPWMERRKSAEKVCILTPHLPADSASDLRVAQQQELLLDLFEGYGIADYIAWYYTPMALTVAGILPSPSLVVYDCMDELSAFKNAPASLQAQEDHLFQKADIVFVGGRNLYNSKVEKHSDIFLFPSSIDKAHFEQARSANHEPADQQQIGFPRLGFFGVIDERLDIALLDQVALQRPDWNIILIGPVVKIDVASLPRRSNIHYLGARPYSQLPAYLSGWDIALIPFARNQSTQYISPTKTPEYLAGGKPVISTSIQDVVTPYGENKLVCIADTAQELIKAADSILAQSDRAEWLAAVDNMLLSTSWDKTWEGMNHHIRRVLTNKNANQYLLKIKEYV